MPARGELNIKDRRSWKTWQLASGMVVAALIGMLLNYHTVGANAPSVKGAYTLPPASGATTTTTASSVATTTTTAATTTTTDGSSTTTTGPSTTTTVSSGTGTTTTVITSGSTTPAQVLLPPTQMSGNWTSPTFATTQPNWNIGWAFRCTPPPAAGPSFQVFVTPAGTAASGAPAVSETGGSGQSVTSQSTIGQQTLVIEAPANCEWVVKVTGD